MNIIHRTAQNVASILFRGHHRTIQDKCSVNAAPGAVFSAQGEEMKVREAAQREQLPTEDLL